jgi:hypothetical protein
MNRQTAPSPEMSPANVSGLEYPRATLLTTQLYPQIGAMTASASTPRLRERGAGGWGMCTGILPDGASSRGRVVE